MNSESYIPGHERFEEVGRLARAFALAAPRDAVAAHAWVQAHLRSRDDDTLVALLCSAAMLLARGALSQPAAADADGSPAASEGAPREASRAGSPGGESHSE